MLVQYSIKLYCTEMLSMKRLEQIPHTPKERLN